MIESRKLRFQRIIRPLALTASVGLLIGLSACAAESTQLPTNKPTKTASSSATPSAAARTSPAATTAPESAVPITASCTDLLSNEIMEKTYPGFELNKNYSPSEGSVGAIAVKDKGIACQWISSDSGSVLNISAAHLGPQAIAGISNGLTGTATPEYSSGAGSKGTFQIANGSGLAQLVTDKYWITADSAQFYSATDAVPIMSLLLAGLEWHQNP